MHEPKPADPHTPENEAQSKPACRQCGKPLPERRKLKDFCSYSCRGKQAVKALEAPIYRSGLVGAKNTRHNKDLQSLKKRARGDLTFARINSCTVRIDTANKRGAGWLMDVGWPGGARQRWVARVGNRASEPMSYDEARAAATAMVRTRDDGKPRDWVAELNRMAADEVDRAVDKAPDVEVTFHEPSCTLKPGTMRADTRSCRTVWIERAEPPNRIFQSANRTF